MRNESRTVPPRSIALTVAPSAARSTSTKWLASGTLFASSTAAASGHGVAHV